MRARVLHAFWCGRLGRFLRALLRVLRLPMPAGPGPGRRRLGAAERPPRRLGWILPLLGGAASPWQAPENPAPLRSCGLSSSESPVPQRKVFPNVSCAGARRGCRGEMHASGHGPGAPGRGSPIPPLLLVKRPRPFRRSPQEQVLPFVEPSSGREVVLIASVHFNPQLPQRRRMTSGMRHVSREAQRWWRLRRSVQKATEVTRPSQAETEAPKHGRRGCREQDC